MKYICECCQNVFDEDELKIQMDKDTGYRYVECPACGEENTMVEAIQCKECEEWINKDEAIEGMCEDCARELLSDTENIRNYIAEECFDSFIDMLTDCFTKETIMSALMSSFAEEAKDYVEGELDYFVKWYNKNV